MDMRIQSLNLFWRLYTILHQSCFGLEKQNLLTQDNINKSPVVNREGDVELSTLAGAVKRQIISV